MNSRGLCAGDRHACGTWPGPTRRPAPSGAPAYSRATSGYPRMWTRHWKGMYGRESFYLIQWPLALIWNPCDIPLLPTTPPKMIPPPPPRFANFFNSSRTEPIVVHILLSVIFPLLSFFFPVFSLFLVPPLYLFPPSEIGPPPYSDIPVPGRF
jgi:hypothetical protein